jgi:serine/threonine protein kinase
MVTPQGVVKLLDFGLVQRTGDPDAPAGTLSYMSPEQVQALPVSASSDVFSFGSVFYEMLTGQKAFAGETPRDKLDRICGSDPPPARDARCQRLIERCLQRDPAKRPAAAEVSAELRRMQTVRPRVRTWAAVATLAVALVGFGIWSKRPPASHLEPG